MSVEKHTAVAMLCLNKLATLPLIYTTTILSLEDIILGSKAGILLRNILINSGLISDSSSDERECSGTLLCLISAKIWIFFKHKVYLTRLNINRAASWWIL